MFPETLSDRVIKVQDNVLADKGLESQKKDRAVLRGLKSNGEFLPVSMKCGDKFGHEKRVNEITLCCYWWS